MFRTAKHQRHERRTAPADRYTELASRLARQHGGNLFGGAVAKELSQRLFVVGDTRLLDQCDEIRRSIARQRRSGKMRIGR